MKHKTTTITLTALTTLLTLTAQNKPDTTKLPPPANQQIDFTKHIKPLFEKSCFGCHGATKRPKSKYDMNQRETTIKGGSSNEPAILIHKSDQSPLIHYIADLIPDLEMPPLDKREKYPQLTKPQISLIRAWIDQGAPWPPNTKLTPPENQQ